MEIEKTDETPEEEIFDSVEDMFKKFDEEDLRWKNKHPVRGYIREWLDKCFPNGVAGGYRAYYILQKPWKILRYWKNQIKYAHQRVSRGWDDRAIWAVDMYLAKIIPEIMKQLKEDTYALPNQVFEGLPYENENTYSYSEESMKIASERWDKILDEIAEGFEIYYQNEGEMIYYEDEENLKKTEKYEKAFDLLRKNFGSLGD